MKYDKSHVLDHGSLRLVEKWGVGDADEGCECAIVEAARQSTQGSFRGWEQDTKLLRHLYTQRPQHSGPFEFAGLTVEVEAPIFVAREWFRHRTFSYAEMSARYAPNRLESYVPDVDRMLQTSTTNKQAQGLPGTALDESTATHLRCALEEHYHQGDELYERALAAGVPKELARLTQSVGKYTRFRATGNLRNWLGFAALRLDGNAQWEIRQYAEALGEVLSAHFPVTWGLFQEGRK